MMELNPGRELDALIAEKVMGLTLAEEDAHENWIPICPEPYSTDIVAAWEVVEEVRFPFEMASDDERNSYNVRFNLDRGEWTQAQTAPHAICLAALKAIGFDTTEPASTGSHTRSRTQTSRAR